MNAIITHFTPTLAWPEAKALFDAALSADRTHEAKYIDSIVVCEEVGPIRDKQVDSIPRDVWDESERLSNIRCDAEEVMIAAPAPDLASVLFKIEYARERWEDFEGWPDAWWNAILADMRRLSKPMPAAIQFDDALAEYHRRRAIEQSMPGGDTIEDEERAAPAFAAALSATSAAFNAMVGLPVSDAPRVAAKLNAVVDFYDLGASGLDRAVLAQIVGEVNAALTGRAA